MRVTVTGGAGYIGSHTCALLLENGHDVQIIDSFFNAKLDVPERISKVSGREVEVVTADVTDYEALSHALRSFQPEAVIHFAGLKAVGESVQNPLEYYRVNVGGSISLLKAMEEISCNKIIYSSSATVYGDPCNVPIQESHRLAPTSPYGHSKWLVEVMLDDWGRAHPGLAAVSLRYFNPVGAHPTALLGEEPHETPNNLMPVIAQVAKGRRTELSVFGNDYDTPDGTCVRDYVHVLDLAAAHLKALKLTNRAARVHSINIGTGQGYSVLDIVAAFKRASNRDIPFKIASRRPGDVATSIADPSLAEEILDWRAERNLDQMCRDAWTYERRRGSVS